MAPASNDSRRSWRGSSRGAVVRRSRNVWRYLLTALAVFLIAFTVYWVWPKKEPRTALLILHATREDRTLPLVPYVAGDVRALLDWAVATKVANCQLTLGEIANSAWLSKRINPLSEAADKLAFERPGSSAEFRLGKGDRLIVYIKAHGLALDVAGSGEPDIQPVLIKRLSERNLATAWYQSEDSVLRVADLVKQLSRLTDLQTLLVLDAVHANYDPRLGVIYNAFPEAVAQAAKDVPSDNLTIVLCQSSGELSAGAPAVGRSAVADSFVRALEREPKKRAPLELKAFLKRWQSRLQQLSGTNQAAFSQTIATVPAELGRSKMADFTLPTVPAPEPDPTKAGADAGKTDVAKEVTKAATQALQNEAAKVTPPPVAAAATTAQNVSQAVGGAPSAGTPASAGSNTPATSTSPAGGTAVNPSVAATADAAVSAPGQPTTAPASATPGAPSNAVAGPAAPPPPPEGPPQSDLDGAWRARDALRDGYREGWTPVHLAPHAWRSIEAILAAFDEELLPAGESRDPDTVLGFYQDLKALSSYYSSAADGGPRGAINRKECEEVALALAAFLNGRAGESVRPRQPGTLDEANQAVRVFSEALYRGHDYVRLHGQAAALPDSNQPVRSNELNNLLDKLATLARLLDPADLAEGRLNDERRLALMACVQDVEGSLRQLHTTLENYARLTASAPPSAGRMLRARLLLGSPLLSARTRRGLRDQGAAVASRGTETLPSTPAASGQSGSVGPRLDENARFVEALQSLAIPASWRGAPPNSTGEASAAAAILFAKASDFKPQGAPLSEWATFAHRLQRQAAQWPGVIKSYEQRMAGSASSNGPAQFDLYRASLLVDPRDSLLPGRDAGTLTIAQPLRAPRIADAIALEFSTANPQLPMPGGEAALLELAVGVTSEAPPSTLNVNLKWNEAQIKVTRQGEGLALRNGVNQVPLVNGQARLPLRVASVTVSDRGTAIPLTASAEFGTSSLTSRTAECRLPRPDVIELTVAASDDLEAARRHTWYGIGELGGQLRLFAGRERAVSLYLTNKSSEEKRIQARLYRVPTNFLNDTERIFDDSYQLTPSVFNRHTELSRPRADAGQILRGMLLAQSTDKDGLVLPANNKPVRVALAPPVPPAGPSGTAAPPASRGDDNGDVTAGLVLVITSADNKSPPHVKWIELETMPPDRLLEIREGKLEGGKLSFPVALREPDVLREELGLAKQPLKLVWEKQSLPPGILVAENAVEMTAQGEAVVSFSATAGGEVPWPLILQLSVDGYPRGLVAALNLRGGRPQPKNLKENQTPVVHVLRAKVSAKRPGGQPAEKTEYVFHPTDPTLPYPSPNPMGEPVPESPQGQLLMIRVDPTLPSVDLDCDLGADIAPRFFYKGIRLKASVAGHSKQFAFDRQISQRLLGIEEGYIRLTSQAGDFKNVAFGTIECPADRRLVLAAEVAGEASGTTRGAFLSDKVTLVLDRTRPTISEPVARKRQPLPGPAGSASAPVAPPVVIDLQCRADDGIGSGIATVEFVAGFDNNRNGRLDPEERRPKELGQEVAQGVFRAELKLPPDLPGTDLLVEAIARDNVKQDSEPVVINLPLPKPTPGGGQRSTWGKAGEIKGPDAKKGP